MRRARSFWPLAMAGLLVFSTPAFAGNTPAPRHKLTQSPSYVAVAPMYSTIVYASRPVGLLMVEIGLDIPSDNLRATAHSMLPVLRDGYLRSLMAFTASSVRPWHQPDVAEIAARLQQVTDRTLKQNGARVLLAQVAMHLSR